MTIDKQRPGADSEAEAWTHIQAKLEDEKKLCEEKIDEDFDGTEGCDCSVDDCLC